LHGHTDSKSTAGNGVGVQVPSRAKFRHQETLENQPFQGFFFAIFLFNIPFGDNLGIIIVKKHMRKQPLCNTPAKQRACSHKQPDMTH